MPNTFFQGGGRKYSKGGFAPHGYGPALYVFWHVLIQNICRLYLTQMYMPPYNIKPVRHSVTHEANIRIQEWRKQLRYKDILCQIPCLFKRFTAHIDKLTRSYRGISTKAPTTQAHFAWKSKWNEVCMPHEHYLQHDKTILAALNNYGGGVFSRCQSGVFYCYSRSQGPLFGWWKKVCASCAKSTHYNAKKIQYSQFWLHADYAASRDAKDMAATVQMCHIGDSSPCARFATAPCLIARLISVKCQHSAENNLKNVSPQGKKLHDEAISVRATNVNPVIRRHRAEL